MDATKNAPQGNGVVPTTTNAIASDQPEIERVPNVYDEERVLHLRIQLDARRSLLGRRLR